MSSNPLSVDESHRHYCLRDGTGMLQGVYYAYDPFGGLHMHNYTNDIVHGEAIGMWFTTGTIYHHLYYVNGTGVHNLKKDPLSDEEKVLLVLKYGAPLLSRDAIEFGRNRPAMRVAASCV